MQSLHLRRLQVRPDRPGRQVWPRLPLRPRLQVRPELQMLMQYFQKIHVTLFSGLNARHASCSQLPPKADIDAMHDKGYGPPLVET